MMPERFLPPPIGPATPVRFPAVARTELSNGLRIWSLPWTPVPIVSVALVFDQGAAHDPSARPGLASLAADLVDEGAGGRDAVEIAEAFARLGTHLEIEVGPDATVLALTTLSRFLDPALQLVADVVMRPHLAADDLIRIRELRVSRLRQLTMSAAAVADRVFLLGLFGPHPYGHGSLGTTRSLEAVTLEEVREFYARQFAPAGATLIVAGDVPADEVATSARQCLGGWRARSAAGPASIEVPAATRPRVLLVDRPGAPQSELRIGHLGPPRPSDGYHALVTLNAALGGQFTSRINQHLREAKGYTYGARTSFDFRRTCSAFACNTSVQTDATAQAVADVLEEYEATRSIRPIEGDELARAKYSLTRGYAGHFETPAHLVRAAVELATFSLPDDTFDRFVHEVSRVSDADLIDAARRFIHPEACVIAVVGDAARCRGTLSDLGRDLHEMTPEF